MEDTAALANLAAQMVEDYGDGDWKNSGTNNNSNFIGLGSPKRGITGEAYLMSVQAGGDRGAMSSGRKPVPVQTCRR